jgi:hypothetical protein
MQLFAKPKHHPVGNTVPSIGKHRWGSLDEADSDSENEADSSSTSSSRASIIQEDSSGSSDASASDREYEVLHRRETCRTRSHYKESQLDLPNIELFAETQGSEGFKSLPERHGRHLRGDWTTFEVLPSYYPSPDCRREMRDEPSWLLPVVKHKGLLGRWEPNHLDPPAMFRWM